MQRNSTALAAVDCQRRLDLASASVARRAAPSACARLSNALSRRSTSASAMKSEADDKTCHVVPFPDAPDFQRRTRQQRIERGATCASCSHREERSRMTPAPRPAMGCDSEDRDYRARARPAIAGVRSPTPGPRPGRDTTRLPVELLLAGEPVPEQRANNPARHVTAGASLPPHPSFQSSCCTANRLARSAASSMAFGTSTPRSTGMPWKSLRCNASSAATGIRVRLIPDGAGKYRRRILVAGDAQRPVGVHDPGVPPAR